jgi:lipopolysaccharide export system permease protein
VVERGKGDGLYINTSGLGWVEQRGTIGPAAVRAGRFGRAFIASATATVSVIALAGVGLFPRLVPVRPDLADSLTIYMRARTSNGELVGLLIHDTRDPDKPITIVAERGRFVDTESGPRVLMVNGSRQLYDRTTGKLSALSFDQYTLDLSSYRDAPELRDRQPDELYLHELLFQPTKPGDTSRLIEVNVRLVNPLTALAFTAIPVACLLTGEFNRRGQTQRVLLAILLAFLFETLDIAFKNLAGRTTLAVPLLYLNVLIPVLTTAWLLWRDGSEPRRAALAAPAPAE